MPVIGLSQYILDFYVLDNNNPKTLIVLDQSFYLDTPEKPTLYIWLPGEIKPYYVPYNPKAITVITSNTLGITAVQDPKDWQDLPDGVYKITLTFCPNDQFFVNKYYLKTTYLEFLYKKLLLALDKESPCLDPETLKSSIIDIDILIQSAKAEIEFGNEAKATTKYKVAFKMLQSITRKLNCI